MNPAPRRLATLAAVAAGLCLWTAPALAATDAATPPNLGDVGPRGPVGPDVPLPADEQARLARRVTVEGRTASAVQTACDTAAADGPHVVFLPAGRYVFEATVTVPGGVTVLGDGSKTRCVAEDERTLLLRVAGDGVRFARLVLEGADTTPAKTNQTHGIRVEGRQNVRIDHSEVLGFSYAISAFDEAGLRVDHCRIHHNLRDGLGYGVAVYSGAWVLVTDNAFHQNRHSLASNGALDWSSGKRLGRYVHEPGVRKTHWEFRHNRVGSNDASPYELCAADTHPGMDGTFVVQGNVFENLRHGVGIRDGSGIIRGNLFRHLRTVTDFRPLIAVSVRWGKHNNIPVEGCMPHHIEVADNVFEMPGGAEFQRCAVGKAEHVTVDGRLVTETQTDRPAPAIPRLRPMGEDGVLGAQDGGWHAGAAPAGK